MAETADLSHTIEGLTDEVEHFVRVIAVNENSATEFEDNDGHSRAAESSAVPGKPGAPRGTDVSPGDHRVSLTWDEPLNNEVDLTGYLVEWKSDGESYDATRRLEVSGASIGKLKYLICPTPCDTRYQFRRLQLRA